MEEPVKRARTYESPRRREQAAQTRRTILAAAQSLFERQGYAATSVPDVAQEAGVAVKTVYIAFEAKARMLRALWDDRLSGEEAALPVAERAWFRELAAEADPEAKLRLVARQSRIVKSRSGALMEVIRNAAPGDDEISTLWKDIEAKLHGVSRSIVEQLKERDALAPGLGLTAAADILWTLNHPSTWQLLVGGRGWTGVRYENWLAAALCSQLLVPGKRRRRTRSHRERDDGGDAHRG